MNYVAHTRVVLQNALFDVIEEFREVIFLVGTNLDEMNLEILYPLLAYKLALNEQSREIHSARTREARNFFGFEGLGPAWRVMPVMAPWASFWKVKVMSPERTGGGFQLDSRDLVRDFASAWRGVQSLGGKATCQNMGLGSVNSTPTWG